VAVAPADALLGQCAALRGWLRELPFEAFGRPSALVGWDVRQLTGHILLSLRGFLRSLDDAGARGAEAHVPPLSVADYVDRYRAAADEIDALTVETAADHTPDELLLELDQLIHALTERLARPLPKVIEGPRGPIATADAFVTRMIELVTHADDLSRSLPDVAAVELTRPALAMTVRGLLGVLVARYPGRSVEVRIPPMAAVQCIAGPRHTRGTPPNVVETEPIVFVRLATGRLCWDDALAAGAVRASGARADLSEQLPLLS